jgi:hypothetical protein
MAEKKSKTKKAPAKPRARPGPKVKAVDLRKVERCAKKGYTKEQIATACGMAPSTFFVKMAEQPEISEAIDRGRDKGVAFAADKLWKAIENGNTAAVFFFLKAKGGWKETVKVQEVADEADRKAVAELLERAQGVPGGLNLVIEALRGGA